MNHNWDVVIVGGGLSGYVAANYAARTDLSVLLLEKGKVVGGRARTNKVKQQYLNLGPHALYKNGKASTILKELNITLHGQSPKLDGNLIENNLEYPAPFTPLNLFTTKLLNGKERIEWMRLLLKIMSVNPDKLEKKTYSQWVSDVTHSKKVEQLLYTLGRLATYSHAPEKMSAKVMISHIKIATKGVLYLDGGWQTIIDQLHNKAILSGVQVQTQTAVRQIELLKEEDQVKLVTSSNEEIIAGNVIWTAGPQELEGMFLDKNISFLNEMTAIKGAALDVALSQLPIPKKLFAMDISDPLYYAVHSAYARLSENSNNVVLHVFKYHHPDEQIDSTHDNILLEQFLDKLQPGWKQYLITKRFLPHITVNQRLPQLGDKQKLSALKSSLPRIYLAGDWASSDSILAEGAVSSGKQAAEELILNEKREKRAN
ncbi:FAD-dependent oxidoreductase [Gracilibacillus massiliensis]|uniref:FAD-dependent oxidoreductase n=1 Tax=Gracilibacillus massiliensis TaxID=1564956 RepID=UPI00071D671C|nr:FAD-dependent oxidoreductase [Gracilibacillus massiliensis]